MPSLENHMPSAEFVARYNEIIANFFSRDEKKWDIFGSPAVKKLVDGFRGLPVAHQSPQDVEGGEAISRDIKALSEVPSGFLTATDALQSLQDQVTRIALMSKNWAAPSCVENVMTMPSDPALYGCLMAMISNPNVVHAEYSHAAADLEDTVVRMMATQVGWNPQQAAGIFTSGGTMCNLYGYLTGLRKAFPDSMHHGIGGEDYRFLHAFSGHYSNTTCLSTLGIDIVDKAITVRNTTDNETDYDDLEANLDACIRMKIKVPVILVTCGTTDTFGFDDIKRVYDIREKIMKKYEITDPTWIPSIHADSAVGWAMVFFRGYDTAVNPLGLAPHALKLLKTHEQKFDGIRWADSCTIDFHKWGFVPYSNSCVVFKDRDSLKALSNDPGNFTYFNANPEGHTVFHSTIECSRGAVGIFGAYTALKSIGVDGYRMLISHGLVLGDYLRHQLTQQIPGVIIIGAHNGGPSVCWRLYNTDEHAAAKTMFQEETHLKSVGDDTSVKAFRTVIDKRSAFHRSVFDMVDASLSNHDGQRKGMAGGIGCLSSDWIAFLTRGAFNNKGQALEIPGQKAVFFNPLCTKNMIDGFLTDTLAAIKTVRTQHV